MKKLLSHFLAIFCAVFTALFFAICSNAAGAPFNVCCNSEMLVGKSQQLAISKEGEKLDNFTFSSSDNSVVTVDENGIVSAEKQGSAKIICTSQSGESVSVDIAVKTKPASITLSSVEKAIDEGESFNLNARVNSGAYQTSFVYSSTDNSVATVSPSGRVTGVKEGKAIITAETENGVKASCIVYVYSKNDIELNIFDI